MRRPTRLRLLAAIGAVLGLAGCARALREPPALESLGGSSPRQPASAVDALLAKADHLYAGRTLDSVRSALGVWLDAAKADAHRQEGLVGAARAAVWLSQHEANRDARARDALLAVQSAQWCGKMAPESPACAYWLGAALGAQADARRSTALDALPRIVEAFKRAAELDPAQDEGGPDRALALIYARAPGWPTGPGDPDLALEHARRAVGLRPGYAPNQLALAEALAATGEKASSRETYGRALELARKAADAGDPDAGEWVVEAEKALRRLQDG